MHRGLRPTEIYNVTSPIDKYPKGPKPVPYVAPIPSIPPSHKLSGGVDVRRLGSARPLALLQTTTARDGLVGLDAKPYIHISDVEAKHIFGSKSVPMTDHTGILKGADKRIMSSRGYGAVPACHPVAVPKSDRIGFDNTLTDTTGGKLKVSKATIIHHPQNAVFTDFHKGLQQGYDPATQPMWADGTYEHMKSQVTKEQTGLLRDIKFAEPIDRRREVFNLQSLAGGEVFGDMLLRQEISGYFKDRDIESIKGLIRREFLRRVGRPIDEAELDILAGKKANEDMRAELARKFNVSVDSPILDDLIKLIEENKPEVVYERPAPAPRREAPIMEEALAELAERVAEGPGGRVGRAGEAFKGTIKNRGRLEHSPIRGPLMIGGGAVGEIAPYRAPPVVASAPITHRAGAPRGGGGGGAFATLDRFFKFGADVLEQARPAPAGSAPALPAPPSRPALTGGASAGGGALVKVEKKGKGKRK